jgi:hypothetical protein
MLGAGLLLTGAALLFGAAQAQGPATRVQGEALLREFAGSDDTDALLRHPQVRPQLQRLLGSEMDHLMDNINVRGSVDVISGWLSVSGNAPHMGTEEEGVVCISVYNVAIAAAILSKETVTVYSPGGSYDSLPICIKDWITQARSQHMDRMTQPANVRMAPQRSPAP